MATAESISPFLNTRDKLVIACSFLRCVSLCYAKGLPKKNGGAALFGEKKREKTKKEKKDLQKGLHFSKSVV
jgi:hypothetical protein